MASKPPLGGGENSLNPSHIRMLCVGCVPRGVQLLDEENGAKMSLAWLKFRLAAEETAVLIADLDCGEWSKKSAGEGANAVFGEIEDRKSPSKIAFRSCVLLTNSKLIIVDMGEARERIPLSTIVSAKLAVDPRTDSTDQCIEIGMLDGRRARLAVGMRKMNSDDNRKQETTEFLATLLGRIAHINSRREMKIRRSISENCLRRLSKSVKFPERNSSGFARKKLHVMVRQGGTLIRAVLRISLEEFVITRVIKCASSLTVLGAAAGAAAWIPKKASVNGPTEFPIKTKRFEDIGWMHLENLHCLAIGFTMGDSVVLHTRAAPGLRATLASLRDHALNVRRERLFNVTCFPVSLSRKSSHNSIAASTVLQEDGSTLSTARLSEAGSASRSSCAGSIESLQSSQSGSLKNAVTSPTSVSTMKTTLSLSPRMRNASQNEWIDRESCTKRRRRQVDYRPRAKTCTNHSLFSIVEKVCLDPHTSAGRVRNAFLERVFDEKSSLQGSEALILATRKILFRITKIVMDGMRSVELVPMSLKEGKFTESKEKEKPNRRQLFAAIKRSVLELVMPSVSSEILLRIQRIPEYSTQEIEFQKRAATLRSMPQSFFGIKEESRGMWSLAVFELSALNHGFVASPMDVVEILLNTVHAINLEYSAVAGSSEPEYSEEPSTDPKTDSEDHNEDPIEGDDESESRAILSADNFFPIWLFVLVNTPLRSPHSWLLYVRAMLEDDEDIDLRGEAGYYITMFEAGLVYITRFGDTPVDKKDSSSKTQDLSRSHETLEKEKSKLQ
mmetsp:Transcript_2782/g.4037  ORF Transcript_2782/g.4037 Transcript_2782/m.4037 type:complete len:786 (-) Transcript_2782:172-2529(-)